MACSQGVDGDSAGLTFGSPAIPSDEDEATTTATTSDGPVDPTANSNGMSDSADPTAGTGDTGDPDPTLDPTDDPADTEEGDESESESESDAESDSDSATGPTGACTPGDTQSCYGGPDGTENVGNCASGTQTCDDDGAWGDCEGDVLPEDESCNDEDDDCDGSVDDGNPGGGGACNTGLSGPCQPGTLVCNDGSLQCDGDVAPAASETCGNDVDDDCNGSIDDGCLCDPMNPIAACGAGEHCFPTETGDTVCQGPTGAGTQYTTCTSDADCSAGHVCVNTGQGTVYCMAWCTTLLDCPLLLDDCIPLDPSVSAGPQEYGVCYDGLP